MKGVAEAMLRSCVGSGLVLLLPLSVAAADWSAWGTQAEIAQLPPHCQAKFGYPVNDEAATKHWEQVFGKPWQDMFHYCLGFVYLTRARTAVVGPARQKRAMHLQEARGHFMYVINAWRQDFALQPEAHLGLGRAWQLSGDDPKAISFFSKAIYLRPDFVQAYAALADLWADRGENAKAREVLGQGLKNTSNDESLVRRMARLEAGGSGSKTPRPGTPLPSGTNTGQGSARKP